MLYKPKSLEELYLNDNKLATLPEWIGELTALKNLDLGNKSDSKKQESNDVDELKADSIDRAASNKLSRLPESIGNLTDLENLNLRNNQLSTLPESICQLKMLRRLWLDGNPLAPFSPAIENWMHNLRDIGCHIRL